MFSRVAKQLIVTLSRPLKLGTSLETPIEKSFCFAGFLYPLYRREFSATIMEDKEQSKSEAGLVAVCQMNSISDVDRNLGICEDLVRKAKSRGAKVCLLYTSFNIAL